MKNKKRILITGVNGVVGSKLEQVLIERGHFVFGVDLQHAEKIYGHGLGKLDNDKTTKKSNIKNWDGNTAQRIVEVLKKEISW